MKKFIMNGYLWKVENVPLNSPLLVDRTGANTVATTDPTTLTVYLDSSLYGSFKTKVVLHELSHAVMFSYGYISMIHSMCYTQYWIPMEEFICNLIANNAKEIFDRAYEIVGDDAIHLVPYYMDRMIS